MGTDAIGEESDLQAEADTQAGVDTETDALQTQADAFDAVGAHEQYYLEMIDALQGVRLVPDIGPLGTNLATMSLEFFQNFPTCNEHWRRHNTALKFLRELMLTRNYRCLAFPNDPQSQTIDIAEIIHGAETEFSFNYAIKSTPWIWQEMVAQMEPETMRYVVCGEGGRSR